MMSSRSAALQSTAPAALKAPAALAAMQRLSSAPATPASAARFTPCPSSPDAAMQLSDAHTLVHTTTVQFQDDMGTTAMSIDTPSYAHSLGLGQPGLQSQFASNAGGLVQDLVQSMSIDEDVGMQPWGTYKPGATFASKTLACSCSRLFAPGWVWGTLVPGAALTSKHKS